MGTTTRLLLLLLVNHGVEDGTNIANPAAKKLGGAFSLDVFEKFS